MNHCSHHCMWLHKDISVQFFKTLNTSERFFTQINISLLLYFIFLLFIAPYHLLHPDSYYYWDWSRHLALSYYDGSPMIAYFIKCSTILFSDTLFALSFVGIAVVAVVSFIIYKTARLYLNKEASYVSMLLWLFSPLVTLDLLHQITYDTPLTLFWSVSIYFVFKYLKHNKTVDLYYLGACIGLMMLSKYSGVVLLVALAIFLITTSYRHLFKSYHLYLSLLLSLVIFSPVIVWNVQHHWVSFIYQFNVHQLAGPHNPFTSMINALYIMVYPAWNFMLVCLVLYWANPKPRNTQAWYLCFVVCMTLICFYIAVGSQATIRIFWLSQYLITASLLTGFCYQELKYRISTWVLIVGYIPISLAILMLNVLHVTTFKSKEMVYYDWFKQVNASQGSFPDQVFTSGWKEARLLFFIKNKPLIYTLNCHVMQNQYALWSTGMIHRILDKSLKSVIFIDVVDQARCLTQYFDHCDRVTVLGNSKLPIDPLVFVYRCVNR